MLDELETLQRWDATAADAKEAVATQVQSALYGAARFERLATYQLGTQEHTLALFQVQNAAFVLLPGYVGLLGYDAATQVIPDRATRIALGGGEMSDEEWQQHLGRVLSPLRTVVLQPFLLEVEAKALAPITRQPDGTFRLQGPIARSKVLVDVAEQGYRFPTSDEWEYACSGGARTLFRWGDEWPPVEWSPVYQRGAEQWQLDLKPNAFGLAIAQDPWNLEFCAEPDIMRGGDGGNAVSADAGQIEAWLTLATPYCGHFPLRTLELLKQAYLRRALSLPDTT